ncbi:Antibiotic biosynthesis monooxygenase [compost metagenome]
MLRDKEDPSLFVFFEVWANKAALDVHSALPHMAEFFEKRMDYLERDFDIQLIEMLSASSASR